MIHKYDDPAIFSEKVCRYIAEGGNIILRIFGAHKKKGSKNKWVMNSNKWYGHVNDWNPADTDQPDPYHIGQFLLTSPKVHSTVVGLETGERYCVMAQDNLTSELISQCIVLLGDEEDAAEEETNDPFKNITTQIQQAVMQRMVNEITGTVDSIKEKKGSKPESNEDLIPLTNGSYMTKESMIAELNERRKNEERLLSEVQQLREHVQKDKETSSQQGGKLGGLLQGLMGLLGNGGGGSGGGNPLSGLMGGMDLGSLLGGMGGMGGDVMKQSAPQGTVGGSMPTMEMPTMPHMNNTQQQSMQPEANPFAPLLSSLMGGMGNMMGTQEAEDNNEDSVFIQNPNPEPKVKEKPKTKDSDESIEEEDNTVGEKVDKELLQELKPLSVKIFEDVFESFSNGGVDAAKENGIKTLVKNAKELGYSKMVMQALCEDAENMASLLLQALPATTRMIVKPLQKQIKPILIDVLENADWSTWD